LKKTYKISEAKLKKLSQDKLKTHGGFSKRTFLIWSEDNGYKSDHKKYNKHKK